MVSPGRRGLTPEEWADARRIESSYDTVSVDELERAAERLVQDCGRAGYVTHGDPDVAGYLNDYATNNPVDGATGRDFAFGTDRSAPDGSTPPVGSLFQAQACARTRNYQVLSETSAGRRLDGYRLYDDHVVQYLRSEYGIPTTVTARSRNRAWAELSASMAGAAEGRVRVFAPEVHARTLLAQTELPALIRNPKVGLDNIAFVTEFPRQPHLPESLNRFLAHDAVRAQVTMDDYGARSPSPRALAARLDSISLPPRLHAERDRETAILRNATSYADLRPRTVRPTGTAVSTNHAGAAKGAGPVVGAAARPASAPPESGRAAKRKRLLSLAKGSSTVAKGTAKLAKIIDESETDDSKDEDGPDV
ncbi:hypothetical protein [Nocardiopsis eucommiae]|uniref:hypothetical protein n=1 Tax=Nocardiopsis eucommiae TaxID=2831970 RepID=UPI003D745B63